MAVSLPGGPLDPEFAGSWIIVLGAATESPNNRLAARWSPSWTPPLDLGGNALLGAPESRSVGPPMDSSDVTSVRDLVRKRDTAALRSDSV